MAPEPDAPLRVLIFTATYNESGNITEWYGRVRGAVPDSDLLIIDDSSPDGTALEVQGLQAQDPRLALISRPAKSGVGSAHKDAMAYALEHGYDVLVTLDADLSHQPEQIPALLARMPEFDFVIGTRARGGSTDYEGFRRLIGRAGNLAARTLIPTGLTEYTTSFRAFSPKALRSLVGYGIREDGYAFFMECVYILHRERLRMTEVPIHLMDRTRGRSKIPRNQIWLSVSTLVQLSLRQLSRHPRGQGL